MRHNKMCKILVLWMQIVALCIDHVAASIYPVRSQLWVPPFQRAEKMFATNKGPIFARNGEAFIHVDVTGRNITAQMDAWHMVVFFYHAENYSVLETVADKIQLLACSKEEGLRFDGMERVERHIFPIQNKSVSASALYHVNTSGWTDTQIFVCNNDTGVAETMSFQGSMEVRNPYGYLPAVLYGLLPFSAILVVGYFVCDVFFAFLLIRHRQQAIHLHYGILLILLLGTMTSVIWSYSFYDMNTSGAPVCCPYPTTFLVAVVFDTLERTLARLMLLVVCLGYGIVRNSLRGIEVLFISILSISYFLSGIGDEVSRGTSSGADFREKPTVWSFVQLLCNLMFIMWIHVSMERILRQLSDQKQYAKLGMYKSLAWALIAFVAFFTLLTVVAVGSRMGLLEWDVEWEWIQLVAWPVLNFVVSVSMCWIWRPTANSSQFAFSMQLPTSDDGSGVEIIPATQANHLDEDSSDSLDEEIEVDLSRGNETRGDPQAERSDAEQKQKVESV